jgi:hypothetical protein
MITGYKLLSGAPSAAIMVKAAELLSKDYGYQESTVIDGKPLLFVVEVHTWYGATPDKPAEPHKGVTVYEAVEEAPITQPSGGAKIGAWLALGAGLAGLAALIKRGM